MHRRRGLTLVELTIGMIMVVALMGAITLLFAYSSKRIGAQGAEAGVQMQVNQLCDEFKKFISTAKSCSVASNGTNQALVCVMPATGTDQDYDGANEHFTPDASVGGREIYNTGFFVWFYMSDNTGLFISTPGTKMTRAIVNNSATPIAANVDVAWQKYYGGNLKWTLIDSLTFTNDIVNQMSTVTINGSSLTRAERSQTTDINGPGTSFGLTQTIYWGNFRNMIVNGSFELPDVSGTGWGYMTNDGLPGGWSASSPTPVEVQFGGFGCQSFKGKQHLELDADVPGSVKQTISTTPGVTYLLTFYYTPRPGCASNDIQVKWNGAVLATLTGNGVGLPGSAAWTLKSYNVTATASTTDLEFIDQSSVGDKTGGLLDNVVMMPK